MTEGRGERIRALFDLLSDLPAEERARRIEAECGGDAALRRELEDLLANAGETIDLPVPPVFERLRSQVDRSPVGPYRLLERIGEGGYGEVFVAEQSEPIRRRVAVKMLKSGMDTKAVLARFEAERQALALMDHPNIAKVHDAGETERGRPYFVMELVHGEPITVFADRHSLSIRERLEMFIPVAQAVQHAHQKGIIHRDLKPSNILVTMADDKPLPKVIDFGIAKATSQPLTEHTLYTEQGQLIGTPEYMSPEQVEMDGLGVDTRTDIYSLGVVLYELLTGTLPFDRATLRSAGVAGIQKMIREREPDRPSTRVSGRAEAIAPTAASRRSDPKRLARALRGDLDWIILKAMEKDRARRYETANALALDVRRYLDDEPVLAGPPSAAYRARKFAKRHRVALGFIAAVLGAILAGLFESNRQRVVAEGARADAERAREEAEAVTTFLTDMLGAADPKRKGKDVSVRDVIDEGAAAIGEKFEGQPLVRARVMRAMGNVYGNLGQFDAARRQLEAALALREEALGSDHLDVASSLHDIATLSFRMGDNAAAREMEERALAIRERELGPDDPEVAMSLMLLGGVMARKNDWEGARGAYERALAIRERALGPDHRETLSSIASLAGMSMRQGDYAAARALYERVIAVRERTQGPDHIDLAGNLNSLAGVLYKTGDYAAARKLWERAIAIREAKLGSDHPDVASASNNLGVALYTIGDRASARPLFERALAIREKSLGPGHPDVAASLSSLGILLQETGDLPAARAALTRALAINEQALGGENVELASGLIALGHVQRDMGEHSEARSLYLRAIAVLEKGLGPEHADVTFALEGLATLEQKLGRHAEARALYERAIRIDELSPGPNRSAHLLGLAAAMRGLGDPAAADSLEARARAIAAPDTS